MDHAEDHDEDGLTDISLEAPPPRPPQQQQQQQQHEQVDDQQHHPSNPQDLKALPALPDKETTTASVITPPPIATTTTTTTPINNEPRRLSMSPLKSGTSSQPDSLAGSHEALNSPMYEPMETVEAAEVGTSTTCVHVLFSSRLGWMCWKDNEASLFAVFERAFACSKATIVFTESLDQFGVELEVPVDQVSNLEKQLWQKSILLEIDRIHGLNPALRHSDTKVLRVTKSLGNTVLANVPRSSITSLETRLRNLEAVGTNRFKEVDAIKEQWLATKVKLEKRMERLEEVASSRPARLVAIEEAVVAILTEELESVRMW
ncbi:hypothetical protein HDU76_003470 [Blyttiomyces sp. JEL0837]|nr:hypothetical protein HDU76_003470 [Blyttiomyces sp. JEL0837]